MIRHLPLAILPALVLSACAPTQQNAATLEQAKAWATGISSAISAAAAVYTGPNVDQVRKAATDIQAAAVAFQTLGDVSTARSAALSLIAMAQQVTPMIAPALGPNAVFVPMGLAVLQAFVASLPVPPAAAPTPPPEMQKTALNGVRQ